MRYKRPRKSKRRTLICAGVGKEFDASVDKKAHKFKYPIARDLSFHGVENQKHEAENRFDCFDIMKYLYIDTLDSFNKNFGKYANKSKK